MRRSIRLRGFDYTSEGAYFVTVVTFRRVSLLGDVVENRLRLSALGKTVAEVWKAIPDHFSHVTVDAFVIMPNHVHGILILIRRGTACRAPTEAFGRPTAGSLPTVLRSFKAATTRLFHRSIEFVAMPLWQRGYYEHVVRDEADLDRLRGSINENPLRWALDRENPRRTE